MIRFATFLIAVMALTRAALAGEVTVSVASNFLPTAETLAADFERDQGHSVVLIHGSTGQLYAQIVAGAPVDVFLSADDRRPALLQRDGRAEEVRTFALGRLMLVSRVAITPETAPEAFAGARVALADPTVAPYGLAATAAMERMQLDTATFQPLLVANVGQVATLFATGNADIAFVAASLLPRLDAPFVLDLDGLHPEIRQDAALLRRADANDAAIAFWDYLFSDPARAAIETAGYKVPR